MLTDLQRKVRRIIAQVPETGEFALAGGAALIVTGVVNRLTNDLDYFAPYPHSVLDLIGAVRSALENEGLRVSAVKTSQSFARLRVASEKDVTYIDFASDYRLMGAIVTDEGSMLDIRELAADKVLALEARGLPRDYIDFAALTAIFSVGELCDLAASKDTGFDPSRLVDTLIRFSQLNPGVFGLTERDYLSLRTTINKIRGKI